METKNKNMAEGVSYKKWNMRGGISKEYTVACHLPRAPSHGGMRTWVEGSQVWHRNLQTPI